MRRIRDTLCTGVDQIRLHHPQLTVPEDTTHAQAQCNQWTTLNGKSLLDAVSEFKKSKHGRYPKSLQDLAITEDLLSFASTIPNCIEKAVALVKAQQSRKRPRIADAEDTPLLDSPQLL